MAVLTPDVRSRILDAAVDLFSEQGYDSTSVQEVVVRAGVTKGAMYHYFTSKEELLFAIYGTGFSEQLATLEVILNSRKDPATALREIIYDTVGNTAAHAKTAAVFAREAARLDQRHLQTLQVQWRQYQDAVRGLIRAAQASGDFASSASPETISWAIFGFTNSMPTWYRPDGPKTADEIAGELADLILAGLQA